MKVPQLVVEEMQKLTLEHWVVEVLVDDAKAISRLSDEDDVPRDSRKRVRNELVSLIDLQARA